MRLQHPGHEQPRPIESAASAARPADHRDEEDDGRVQPVRASRRRARPGRRGRAWRTGASSGRGSPHAPVGRTLQRCVSTVIVRVCPFAPVPRVRRDAGSCRDPMPCPSSSARSCADGRPSVGLAAGAIRGRAPVRDSGDREPPARSARRSASIRRLRDRARRPARSRASPPVSRLTARAGLRDRRRAAARRARLSGADELVPDSASTTASRSGGTGTHRRSRRTR